MKLPPGYVAGQGVVKASAHGGFGERMLKKLGWSNGEGLGKTRSGISSAIEVKKKEDTVGIGGNVSYQWDEKWWEKAFDSAAQQTTMANDSDTTSTDSDASDSDSDSDQEGPCAPATSTRSMSMNRDGTKTSASLDELKLQMELSKSGSKLAAGRFGGRDGKMARIRAQEAEMALKAASSLGIADPSTSDRSDTTSDAHLEDETDKKKSKKAKKNKSKTPTNTATTTTNNDNDEQEEAPPPKKQRIVIEAKLKNAQTTSIFIPTPTTGWWGAKIFTSVGCLEGLEQEMSKKRGFTEDDQEAIYNAAQNAKTQGKKGMGQSMRALKVGGVKWAGNKVSFDVEGTAAEEKVNNDDDDGGDDDNNGSKKKKKSKSSSSSLSKKLKAVGSSNHLDTDATKEEDNEDDEDTPTEKKKKNNKNKNNKEQKSGGSETNREWIESIKWKKVIRKSIESAPSQQMKLKQLKTEVAEIVLQKIQETDSGSSINVKEVKAVVVQQIEKNNSKFVIEGKYVLLKK